MNSDKLNTIKQKINSTVFIVLNYFKILRKIMGIAKVFR